MAILRTRLHDALCFFAGGENGFLKRPGMVDEYDQQVSTHMDGELCTLTFLPTEKAHQECCLQPNWCLIVSQDLVIFLNDNGQ